MLGVIGLGKAVSDLGYCLKVLKVLLGSPGIVALWNGLRSEDAEAREVGQSQESSVRFGGPGVRGSCPAVEWVICNVLGYYNTM